MGAPPDSKELDLVYPSCVGVLTAIAYFSIVYCFTCMKTHIASEIESGEVVYKEKYRHFVTREYAL
jgi:deoxycytidylate deaminase